MSSARKQALANSFPQRTLWSNSGEKSLEVSFAGTAVQISFSLCTCAENCTSQGRDVALLQHGQGFFPRPKFPLESVALILPAGLLARQFGNLPAGTCPADRSTVLSEKLPCNPCPTRRKPRAATIALRRSTRNMPSCQSCKVFLLLPHWSVLTYLFPARSLSLAEPRGSL
jgi:hypothetical protein